MTDHLNSAAGHFHAVRFYKDSNSLSRIVASFLADGLKSGQPVVVIATPDHRATIVKCLRDRSFDVPRLEREGAFALLDADATLSQFMVDGMPDRRRFTSTMTRILERLAGGRPGRTVYAYGEMVDVLWKAGHTAAAVRIETLWNELAAVHQFALLCGYALGSFCTDATQHEQITALHSHLLAGSPADAAV